MYGSNTRDDRSGSMVGSSRRAFAARYGRLVAVFLVAFLASLMVRAQATPDDILNELQNMGFNLQYQTMIVDYLYNIIHAADHGSAAGGAINVFVEGGTESLQYLITQALVDWSDGPGPEPTPLTVNVDPWALNDASVDDPDDFELPDLEPTIEGFTGSFGQVQTEVTQYQSDREQIANEIIDSGGSIWDKLKARIVGIYEAFSVTEPTGIYWVVGDWTLVDLSATDFYDFGAVRNVMPFVWGAVLLFGAVRIIQRGVA